jgi:acyl-CoA thioester hydrolase
MVQHDTEIQVRYYETDQMGYMHHSNYARYYECARTDAIKAIGYSYAQSEKDGTIMPVVKIESKFLKPLFYDDIVRIKTIIKEKPRFGIIHFFHEFYNAKNELMHEGQVYLAMINTVTNKRENGPPAFMEKFAQHFDKK